MIDPLRMEKCTQFKVSGFDTLATCTQGTYPSHHFSSFFPSRHYTHKRCTEGKVGLDYEWFRLGRVVVETKQTTSYSTRPRIPTARCCALSYPNILHYTSTLPCRFKTTLPCLFDRVHVFNLLSVIVWE